MSDKLIFLGRGEPHSRIDNLPEPPPWRRFSENARRERGMNFHVSREAAEMVNAALYLRRPLLVTGKPGTGKSSLAYAVAHELNLGRVLVWPITTRSTLQQGLYSYDAIARLHDASLQEAERKRNEGATTEPQDIGKYLRLGPLGTAMLPLPPTKKGGRPRPRVLLIDEIDKSDIDLPNDLLNIFEEGEFIINELARLPKGERSDAYGVMPYDSDERVQVERGVVRCSTFPLVILTSNGEREFPPAFLRRCLRLELKPHTKEVLAQIVKDRLAPSPEDGAAVSKLIDEFVDLRDAQKKELATDQLLNAVYLLIRGLDPLKRGRLKEAILKSLSEAQ